MRYLSASPLRRIPEPYTPTAGVDDAIGSLLLWTVTLLLTLTTLACRFALRVVRALLHLLSITLVYLILAGFLLAAALVMLAFHSIAFISGNVP